ncbi:hypothetical protein NAEX_01856 [Nannocystis exedens]|nr:hypothetical protein NAEX_01856 [Nannocystis exedens]
MALAGSPFRAALAHVIAASGPDVGGNGVHSRSGLHRSVSRMIIGRARRTSQWNQQTLSCGLAQEPLVGGVGDRTTRRGVRRRRDARPRRDRARGRQQERAAARSSWRSAARSVSIPTRAGTRGTKSSLHPRFVRSGRAVGRRLDRRDSARGPTSRSAEKLPGPHAAAAVDLPAPRQEPRQPRKLVCGGEPRAPRQITPRASPPRSRPRGGGSAPQPSRGPSRPRRAQHRRWRRRRCCNRCRSPRRLRHSRSGPSPPPSRTTRQRHLERGQRQCWRPHRGRRARCAEPPLGRPGALHLEERARRHQRYAGRCSPGGQARTRHRW